MAVKLHAGVQHLAASSVQPLTADCEPPPDCAGCIAVLTRSGVEGGEHGAQFGALRDGLLRQDFPYVHHVVSTPNASCSYLPPHRAERVAPCGHRTTVVRVPHKARVSHERCPFNAYLHPMLDAVGDDSWIMVLDDDALLLSGRHLSNVMRVALNSTSDTLLLQPTFVGPEDGNAYTRKARWPQRGWRDASTAHWRVDMSNLVFHKRMARHIDLRGERCGGDKEIARQLLRAGAKLQPLVGAGASGSNPMPVGVWANYFGARSGRASGADATNLSAVLAAAAEKHGWPR